MKPVNDFRVSLPKLEDTNGRDEFNNNLIG